MHTADVVLIAERDVSSRAARAAYLHAAGFDVIEAATAVEGLAVLGGRTPAVLVLHASADPVETWRLLQDGSSLDVVPVLHLWPGSSSAGEWTRGLDAGGDAYLVDPVDPRAFVALVQALVRRGNAHATALHARERVEVSRLASEGRYRSVIEGAPCGICCCATDGTILAANAALATISGEASAAALVGRNVRDLFEDSRVGAEWIRRWRSERSPAGQETKWLRADDDIADVVVSARHGVEPHGEAMHVFVDDVTSRRRLEDEFRHVQKMDAVGRLAGGVAHDFNNILTAILGYCDIIRDDLGPEHATVQDLAQIRQAAQMAASLTTQLLAFSRRQVLQLQSVDLGEVVAALEPMLRRLVGEQIDLAVDCEESLPPIEADPAQLQQVIMNLVVNARDATASAGRIAIECVRMPPESLPAAARGFHEPGAEFVQLKVSDTGGGISEDVQAHLFEPFFTTKERGRGTGLGLATVYGIVTQLRGWIDVDPGFGRGATFRIVFPARLPRGAASKSCSPPSPAVPSGGPETVLLVEDEEAVRTLAYRVLTRHGYRVLPARSPRAAVQVATAHEGSIDLVLTDVIMPGMGVREMVARLRARIPIAPVLYMSGYTTDAIVDEGVVDGDVRFLLKPFSPNELLQRVREVLDGRLI